MYKNGVRLQRLISSIRVLPPLAVRHLDWYLKHDFLPDDYIHYLSHHKISEVNHRVELQDHVKKAAKSTRCKRFSKLYGAVSENSTGLLPQHLFRFANHCSDLFIDRRFNIL